MGASIREILLKLCRREDLTRAESRDVFLHIMSGDAPDAQIGGLLIGMAAKGTTVDELVGAALVMREKVIPLACDTAGVILDTCGTGGDVKGTFNISTAAALVAAGAGIKVVKHGNRSASSSTGSADVLEKLGVSVETSPTQMLRCLAEANVCFAFSRTHHPAMKFVAGTRAALGIPTIFNLLGPLTNPGRARHQLLGVFAPELTDRMAEVLREIGSECAWVVHAEDGLDELSTLGPTRISELRNGSVQTRRFDPRDLGIDYARLSDLQVGSADDSAEVIRQVLAGKPGPARDIVTLNAAAAIHIAEGASNLVDAFAMASDAIDSGAARRSLEALARESRSQV
jgi:anthranilate phosphoribosyltransferase